MYVYQGWTDHMKGFWYPPSVWTDAINSTIYHSSHFFSRSQKRVLIFIRCINQLALNKFLKIPNPTLEHLLWGLGFGDIFSPYFKPTCVIFILQITVLIYVGICFEGSSDFSIPNVVIGKNYSTFIFIHALSKRWFQHYIIQQYPQYPETAVFGSSVYGHKTCTTIRHVAHVERLSITLGGRS